VKITALPKKDYIKKLFPEYWSIGVLECWSIVMND
jgi:hypothetical protein